MTERNVIFTVIERPQNVRFCTKLIFPFLTKFPRLNILSALNVPPTKSKFRNFVLRKICRNMPCMIYEVVCDEHCVRVSVGIARNTKIHVYNSSFCCFTFQHTKNCSKSSLLFFYKILKPHLKSHQFSAEHRSLG